jgi:RNA polymerase sigma-70 factor (ECF subfamily)
LLARARSKEDAAWERLVSLYSPLVHRWCRQARLQASDADDVCQEVFRAVYRRIQDFQRDADHGTFRGWLWTITRRKLCDHWKKLQAGGVGVGGSDALEQLEGLPTPVPPESAPTGLHEDLRLLYQRALDLLSRDFEEKTWKAFWETVIRDRPAADVAKDLEISRNAVHKAKGRVLARLREEFQDILRQ